MVYFNKKDKTKTSETDNSQTGIFYTETDVLCMFIVVLIQNFGIR